MGTAHHEKVRHIAVFGGGEMIWAKNTWPHAILSCLRGLKSKQSTIIPAMSLVVLELWKLLKVPKRWHGKRNKVCFDTLLLLSILKSTLPNFGFCHGLYSALASTLTLNKDPVPTSVVVVQRLRQLLNHVWLFATPWTAAYQTSLSFIISQSLFKFMSIESVMPSNHLVLCHPLLLLPSIFPSIRIFFQWVSSLYPVAKILELQHQSFQWLFRVDFI